ncbi:hypothetical protein [Arcticibacter sp. MXS-1]|uniref:hypothetical protein n=1 Tax=Arcticibacter sp. MXS-1 TaxID=3341726 RepID=UPI0035A830B1
MTFEEFFAKKKIDLQQLEKADHALYTEFKTHFSQMGEKSFDHSKKFWFNKLRHLYRLQESPKEVLKQAETSIASQSESLSSPTIEQAAPAAKVSGFKPRFKAAATKTEDPEAVTPPDSGPQEAKHTAPSGTRPAFKPRNVKPVSGTPSEDAQKVESRPGQTEVSGTPVVSSPENSDQKTAGYKPRFAARNIPESPSGAAEQTGHTVEQQHQKEDQKGEPSLPEPAKEAPKEAENARPAYKPRFNMKNTRPAAQEQQESKQENAETAVPQENRTKKEEDKDPEKPSDSDVINESPKPAYKPRFNIKNIKPKPDAEQ